MSIVSVHIPQIGEGLQEARLVAVLKKPGDPIKRDEPIYQMETDKAVMDVESPYEGVLLEWIGKVDDILPIGSVVARMDISGVAAGAAEPEVAPTVAVESTDAQEVPIVIPQIGEGLQEARVVAFLKQPGDTIKRDEPIYQMETDKAVMDVESPVDGVLIAWNAQVDDVLAIGAEVARVRLIGAAAIPATIPHPSHAEPAPVAPEPPAAPTGGILPGLQGIPPRTRAYAREKGVSDAALVTIPAAGSKLLPSDVDIYLLAYKPESKTDAKFVETPLSAKQRVLNSRMVRSGSVVVPGTMTVVTGWEAIEAERARIKASGAEFQPSAFTMFAYCVARTMRDFPAFKSTLQGDDRRRTYHNGQLGIAVALPEDQLVLAVVEDADSLSWNDFATRTRERIDLARNGKDQANEAVTVSLTNMQAFGLRDAIPVVVAPSMATIFLGEVFPDLSVEGGVVGFKRVVNMTMTFDHRLANGVGAAEFMAAIKRRVENIAETLAEGA